jgi:cytochrome b involved in lipid metabolism
MNVKKELTLGIIGSIIVIGMTMFYANEYKLNIQKLSVNKVVNQNPSGAVDPGKSTKTVILTASEVAKHNQAADCWIIINNSVYQVTEFLTLHPGGASIIIPYCGADATLAYDTKDGRGSHSSQANQDLSSLKLGTLGQTINQINNTQVINNIKNLPKRERRIDDD